MQIDYDPQADAVYVQLRPGDIDEPLTVGKYIYVDVDEESVPLGLEVLFAGVTNADIPSTIRARILPATG